MKLEYKYLKNWVVFRKNRYVKIVFDYFQNFFKKSKRANDQLKTQLYQFVPFLIASVFAGITAVLYSKLFVYSEKITAFIYEKNSFLFFVFTPLAFLVSWWFVKKFAPYSKGSGIPQVMAAIEISRPSNSHIIPKLLSFKVLTVKIISSVIKVMGGGILGREGPTIQVTGSIFLEFQRYLPKWWPHIAQKNVIIAGAASGLAAAFNTPLGGIIFAIEELSKYQLKYYKSSLFVAVVIAGLTAQALGGSYLYLGFPYLEFSGWKIYLLGLLVAVVSGLFAARMCVVMAKFMKFINSYKTVFHQVAIIFLCGVLVAGFLVFLGENTVGSGKALMGKLLFENEKSVEWFMPFVRMTGLIATFSFGGAGGVFAPSLSAGASFGALAAQIFNLADGNANLLIMIGMVAFLTGVTRAPFTSAIIVIEMTDRHGAIFFLMIGALLANMVAGFVDRKSFYEKLKEDYISEIEKEENHEIYKWKSKKNN